MTLRPAPVFERPQPSPCISTRRTTAACIGGEEEVDEARTSDPDLRNERRGRQRRDQRLPARGLRFAAFAQASATLPPVIAVRTVARAFERRSAGAAPAGSRPRLAGGRAPATGVRRVVFKAKLRAGRRAEKRAQCSHAPATLKAACCTRSTAALQAQSARKALWQLMQAFSSFDRRAHAIEGCAYHRRRPRR